MKKIVYCLIVFSVLLFTTSCKKALKDVNDYFPRVKIISAIVQTDGSVLVTGQTESEGNAPIEYMGFCFATSNNPDMTSNQIMLIANGSNTFSATYSGANFYVDSVYYFRTWATNNYGYAYGNSIAIDSIIGVSVTPPCTLTLNTVNIGGLQPTATYYAVSQPTEYMGTWEFRGSTSAGPIVDFKFGSTITTGIYTTTTNSSPGVGQVYISFYSGFISGTLSSGSNVYVNTIASKIYDMSICNAPWKSGSSTVYFNTRCKVPY